MADNDPGAAQYEYDWQNPNKKSFDFGRVFGRSFSGVFANVKPLLVALAIVISLTTLLSLVSSAKSLEIVEDVGIQAASTDAGYLTWSIGVTLPTILFALWFQLIIVKISYAKFTNQPQPTSPLTSTLRYILPMLAIAIIYYVVSSLGMFFLMIGFLFIWPGWALAGPILVHEKMGIFGSLGEAWRLSKGSKRWIFLLLVLLCFVAMGIYMAAMGMVMPMLGADLFSGDPTAALNLPVMQKVIMNLIAGVAGYFAYGIFASGLTAAYVEVKTMKDGAPNLSDIFA